jgi:HD-GYP domain-containing protein (c-di-GMP phosphodiesterase class II)
MNSIILYVNDLNLQVAIKKVIHQFNPGLQVETLMDKQVKSLAPLNNCIFITDQDISSHKIKTSADFESFRMRNLFVIEIQDIPLIKEFGPLQFTIRQKELSQGLIKALSEIHTYSSIRPEDKKYIPVPITHIAYQNNFPCDLYTKGLDQLITKALDKGKSFDEDFVDQQLAKSIFTVLVEKEEFTKQITLIYKKDVTKSEMELDQIEDVDLYMESVYDLAQKVGINKQTVESSNKLFANITKASPQKVVKNLFKEFKKSQGTFLYSHSYFTGILCMAIGKKMRWSNNTMLEKLFTAAIIHDMGYSNPDNASMEALDKSEIMKLDPEQRKDILDHIPVLVKKLQKQKDISDDILKIVQSHHGARGAESYPKESHGSEMNLLSGLFLLCHTLAVKLFESKFNPESFQEILTYIQTNYAKGNIRQLMPEFIMEVKSLFKD